MGLIVALILALIGIILLFGLSKDYLSRKPALPAIGYILILTASYCIGSLFIIKDGIKEREQVLTSKETLVYQLVPFNFASSEYEIEHSKSNSSYYIRFFEEDKFHFYFKTNQNGVDGFTPETIRSNNVFISANYEGTPMIIKTTSLYEFPITKFEKVWLSSDSILTLRSKTTILYEIYVPEGSIIETFSPEL